MGTRDLEGIWEAHARHDPLWAILSDPTKKNRGWEIDRFFESGEREVRSVLRDLAAIPVNIINGAALDFGCGVGRLSHALAGHFDRVTGVDISPTMVELASELNDRPERVRFVHNARDDLADFETAGFDFVYTNIVLQHIPPGLTKTYVAEFLRVLRPGGILVFQLPSHLRPEEDLHVRAMPDDAYRAEIHAEAPPGPVTPATRVGLRVRVLNTSAHAWHPTALGQVNLGNHWVLPDGAFDRQDDARAGLPAVVGPGEEAEILIAVTTPSVEGEYACELDLVHETITWFADRGSPTCRLPFEVSRSAGAPPPPRARRAAAVTSKSRAWELARARLPESTIEPEPFPMFGIPRDETVAMVTSSGGEIVSIDEDGHAGWEWIGYRYTVRKPQ